MATKKPAVDDECFMCEKEITGYFVLMIIKDSKGKIRKCCEDCLVDARSVGHSQASTMMIQ